MKPSATLFRLAQMVRYVTCRRDGFGITVLSLIGNQMACGADYYPRFSYGETGVGNSWVRHTSGLRSDMEPIRQKFMRNGFVTLRAIPRSCPKANGSDFAAAWASERQACLPAHASAQGRKRGPFPVLEERREFGSPEGLVVRTS